MAARKKATPEVPYLDVSNGYDELNLGRLALISSQKTVPPTLRKWQKNVLTPDGRPVVITCAAIDDQVVPHGLDNDFMVALLNLCFEAGLPDGPFSVSAYGLLKAAGFPDTAQYYRSLEESVIRLNKAQYTIDEGWYTQGTQRWTTQSFAQISYLSYARSVSGVRGTSLITVQLAPPIMDSLRSGYIKPLDLNFYRQLSQPLVRAVYRQLDTLQFDDSTPTGLAKELEFPLMAWASRLGIMSDRPDNVERTLKPAHDELQSRGYVQQVEFKGRGKDKMIRYVFGPPPKPEYPALAQLLAERGVKQGVAARFSTVFPDRIEEAVKRFDHYMSTTQRPVGNPGGLLVAMVQRPEDFADLPGYRQHAKSEGTKSLEHRKVAQDQEIVRVEKAQSQHIQALDGAALAEWVYRQLTLIGVMKRLTPHERALLQDALERGRLDGRKLLSGMTKALAGGREELNAAIENLQLVLVQD